MSTYCRYLAGVYPCPDWQVEHNDHRPLRFLIVPSSRPIPCGSQVVGLSIGWQIIEIPRLVARSQRAWQAWGPALQIAPYWRANSLTSAVAACRERLDRGHGRGVQPIRGTRR